MLDARTRVISAMAASIALLALGCGETRTGDETVDETSLGQTHDPADPSAEDPALAAPRSANTRTIYVPAYSHLSGGGDRQLLLAITLSVRNVDPSATVTLTQVEYFDTSGHRVRRYLRRPRTLRPLETAEFSVDTLDDTGGSGANFLVYWEGPPPVHPLLTEAIMFGHVGTGYISFTSRGVDLPTPPWPDAPREPTPTPEPVDDPSDEAPDEAIDL